MKKALLILSLALLSGFTFAQTEAPAVPETSVEEKALEHPIKPLLWKVEGEGLEKPVWLFGTIHLGNGPLGTLHPAAAKALDGADSVYTELPMDMTSQLGLTKHFLRKDGKSLEESIGAELSKQLDAELKVISPLLDAKPFQSFKTWAVGVMVPLLPAQLEGTEALDMIIWKKAEKAKKTLGSLEKATDQFGIFDGLEEEEQIILLAEGLRMQKEAREQGTDPMANLIDAYVSGDTEKIEAEIERNFTEMIKGEHKELGEKLLKRLLVDRNVSMAATIGDKIKAEPAKSHFFAVGAGHYVGKDSIGEILTKNGYKVTRITE